MKKDLEYELLVKEIYATLLKAKGFESIEVKHDIKLTTSYGQERQIDVCWEYKFLGLNHRVAIECKHYNSAIKISMVSSMKGMLDDFLGMQGIIVTKVGFQKGAIKYAVQHGIRLRVIRAALDEDYESRIRTIQINAYLKYAELVALKPDVDNDWILHNMDRDEAIKLGSSISIQGSGKEIMVQDRITGKQETMDDLLNSLPVLEVEPLDKDDVNTGRIYSQKFDWDSAFLISPNNPNLPIKSITMDYTIFTHTEGLTVGGRDIAQIIIKDAIEGHLLFVDEVGSVTGDIEEGL